MINPHGSETLLPLLVTDKAERATMMAEAESLPSMVFLADALSVAEILMTHYQADTAA
jgi:hypothetical protein